MISGYNDAMTVMRFVIIMHSRAAHDTEGGNWH